MSFNSRIRKFRPTLVARMLIAALLAAALMSGIVPPGLTSSGHLCTMECCVGKPPHEAGSCSHGSCEVSFTTPEPPPPPKEQEELCGAHKPQTAQHSMTHMQGMTAVPVPDSSSAGRPRNVTADFSSQKSSPQTNSQRATTLAASALTKPCPPECGTGATSNSTQSRPRETAALAYAIKPRPPSSVSAVSAADIPSKKLRLLCRQCAPRAPPAFAS